MPGEKLMENRQLTRLEDNHGICRVADGQREIYEGEQVTVRGINGPDLPGRIISLEEQTVRGQRLLAGAIEVPGGFVSVIQIFPIH